MVGRLQTHSLRVKTSKISGAYTQISLDGYWLVSINSTMVSVLPTQWLIYRVLSSLGLVDV